MSKYENYNEVSSCYDEGRYPAGADIIAGLLHVHGGKPLKVRVIRFFINKPKRQTFAPREDSDQPAHWRRLIRIFSGR